MENIPESTILFHYSFDSFLILKTALKAYAKQHYCGQRRTKVFVIWVSALKIPLWLAVLQRILLASSIYFSSFAIVLKF